MGILASQLASIFGLGGKKQPTMKGAVVTSKTHATGPAPYQSRPADSQLDLDGKEPEKYKNPEIGVDYTKYKKL